MANHVRSIVSDAIHNKLNDPRIAPMTSVTRVVVSADLQNAKVYVSVFGEPGEVRRTVAGLQHAAGRIQRILARSLHTRQCPHLRIELDETIRKTAETIRIIDESVPDSDVEAEEAGPEDAPDQYTDGTVW